MCRRCEDGTPKISATGFCRFCGIEVCGRCCSVGDPTIHLVCPDGRGQPSSVAPCPARAPAPDVGDIIFLPPLR